MACLPIGLGFDPHGLIHFESKVRRSSDLFGSQAPNGAQGPGAAPRFDQLEALQLELGKRLAIGLWIHFGFMILYATSRLEPLDESLNPDLLLLAIGSVALVVTCPSPYSFSRNLKHSLSYVDYQIFQVNFCNRSFAWKRLSALR